MKAFPYVSVACINDAANKEDGKMRIKLNGSSNQFDEMFSF
jgi:hypothetical protein